MTSTHRFSVSVAAAVIREDGRLLAIQRRDNGHWEPPGGMVEAGETLREALIREVEEETGYVIEPGSLSGVYQNMVQDIVALVFRATAAGGLPRTSDESCRVEWLSTDQVSTRMSDAFAVRLLDAVSADTGATVRCHDGTSIVRQ